MMRDRNSATLRVPVFAALVAFACPGAGTADDACRLELEGLWQEATSFGDTPSMLLSFSADGSVTLLEPSADTPVWNFEQLGAVGYKLAPRSAPERIEFEALRGNDFFARGTTVWEISAYGDERFAVRRPQSVTGEEWPWVRVRTRRYFLTLAARTAREESGGPAAFLMWTRLDGEQIRREAMGVYSSGPSPDDEARFGRIPQELADAFAKESGRASDVMMRIELNEAEYLRAHRILEAWDVLLTAGLLADDEPHRHAFELISATVDSANRCSLNLKLADVDLSAPTQNGEARAREQLVEIVRSIRQINDRWHVRDKTFPFEWKAAPVVSSK